MIDFHCHLDLYPDPHAVAREAISRGIRVLSVTTTPSAWRGTVGLSNSSPQIMTALGLHPQLVGDRMRELKTFEQLIEETRFVGEIGLDGAPEYAEYWGDQEKVFDGILRICRAAGGRIMTIHSRRATNPVLNALEAVLGAGTPILHWYSGTIKELRRAIDLGCWFSVNHAMLTTGRGLKAVSAMPRTRVLTETDGPFTWVGSETMKPWHVELSLAKLAEIWEITVDATNTQLNQNLESLLSSQ